MALANSMSWAMIFIFNRLPVNKKGPQVSAAQIAQNLSLQVPTGLADGLGLEGIPSADAECTPSLVGPPLGPTMDQLGDRQPLVKIALVYAEKRIVSETSPIV